MLKNKGFRVVFAVLSLTLLFICPVLAIEPVEKITGWDKAKFGMSPQELKEAYRGDIERLELFEVYKEEQGYRQLSFTRVIKRSLALIYFYFVDKRLFEIQITFSTERDIRSKRRLLLLSHEMEYFLRRKYILPSISYVEEEFKNLEMSIWEDRKGNKIILTRSYYPEFYRYFRGSEKREFVVTPRDLNYSLEIVYCDGKLTEVWEEKIGVRKESKEVEIESF